MTEGWLIYNQEDYEKNKPFADLLMAAAARRGLSMSLRFADVLPAGMGGGEGVAAPSFAIHRARDAGLARRLEAACCRVFNPSETARVGNDKIEGHALAARLGLPQVDMAVCRNDPGSLVRHGLGYPVVVKNPMGHGGTEVCLAHDEAELLRAGGGFASERVLVQRLCGQPGVDVRVYVLGNKTLRAVRRSSGADFRANLSLGGTVEYYELSRGERALVERLAGALTLDFAGVDFILDERGGFLFNEIEDAVGCRSLYRLGGVDAADLFLEHVSAALKAGK